MQRRSGVQEELSDEPLTKAAFQIVYLHFILQCLFSDALMHSLQMRIFLNRLFVFYFFEILQTDGKDVNLSRTNQTNNTMLRPDVHL